MSIAQRIISATSGVGSSSPMPLCSTGSACSRFRTPTAEAAICSGFSRSLVSSIRNPSTASMRTNGRPSTTGSELM